MSKKVRPSEQKRKMIDQLVSGEWETEDFVSQLLKLGTEQILQETMEQERTELLDRDWYARQAPGESTGYRNGYQDVSVKTTAGTLDLKKPRVRETDQPFESQVLQRLDTIEQRLAQLTIEMYTRGLSTRDIEATLVDQDGTALVSRSSVSRITEALTAEYEDFIARDLSQYDVVYLFVDGVYEAVRSYTNNQAILAAWAICSDGTKVLLHLAAVQSESTAAWSEFFADMVQRGLRQPLFIVSDGNKGAHAAIARYCPESKRGRCIAHKLRNLSVKVPQDVQAQVLADAKAVYYAPNREVADTLATRFIETYSDHYPALIRSFEEDREACLAHLEFPQPHRQYIRTTNLLERAFQEEKRRTKVIPQHINEQGALKLVYGVLIRASRRWNRVTMAEPALATLRKIRAIMSDMEVQEVQQISLPLAA